MSGRVQISSVSTGNVWASPLALVEGWGPKRSSAAVVCPSTEAGGTPTATTLTATTSGLSEMVFPWASVTKLLTSLSILIAVEETTVSLDDELPPLDGARSDDEPLTLRMVLAHAGGVHPDRAERIAAPLTRRIYSNGGVRLAAQHLERQAGMAFADYCHDAVLGPLNMSATFVSDPAAGAAGPLVDLIALVAEFMSPSLIAAATLAEATRPQWPDLDGVLPGFGPQRRNLWGLGCEIRGSKSPHWTGHLNSTQTFGHFGQSGSMLWVDPEAQVGVCALSSDPFGPWAQSAWPVFSDAVLAVRTV